MNAQTADLIAALQKAIAAEGGLKEKSMSQVYFGNWSSKEEMAKDFSNDYGEPLHKAMMADVIFAAYDTGNYEGDAMVLFRDGTGKLFEVHGSHCSCYGLEGKWDPEEIEPEVLVGRLERAGDYGIAANYREQIKAAVLHPSSS